jgi:hypothetical protein
MAFLRVVIFNFVPIPVTGLSKARVCGLSPAGVVVFNPAVGIDVCLVSVGVLSGRGLCDEPITRPEESYRLWCFIVCDIETSRIRRDWPALGCSITGNKFVRCSLAGCCRSFLRVTVCRVKQLQTAMPSILILSSVTTFYFRNRYFIFVIGVLFL